MRIGDGGMPYRVDVHEGNSQKVACRFQLGKSSNKILKEIANRSCGGDGTFRNDDVNLFLGTKDLDGFSIFL